MILHDSPEMEEIDRVVFEIKKEHEHTMHKNTNTGRKRFVVTKFSTEFIAGTPDNKNIKRWGFCTTTTRVLPILFTAQQ